LALTRCPPTDVHTEVEAGIQSPHLDPLLEGEENIDILPREEGEKRIFV
jgi:hypothetical protein